MVREALEPDRPATRTSTVISLVPLPSDDLIDGQPEHLNTAMAADGRCRRRSVGPAVSSS